MAEQIHLLSPAELGVKSWNVGDFARYRFDRPDPKLPAEHVTFRIAGILEPEHAVARALGQGVADHYWMQIRGLEHFRDRSAEVVALISRDDLRRFPPRPAFRHLEGYIPLSIAPPEWLPPAEPAELVALGKETVE
ncbi:MAG: hypothetical protein MI919_23700, partial [Holophagales bacterium]|nr:hypothetical protein [Holophagales bacterium]